GNPLFEPQIGVCERKGSVADQVVCTKNMTLQGIPILPSKENSVVVYDSKTPAGLIIHRAYALLNATDGTYLLTKGDNNAFLDQQTGFNLIQLQKEQRVLAGLPFLGALTTEGLQGESALTHKGNVLLRIPYIGYIKLLVFLQIQAPPGCDSVLKS
ncbi:MAG TPA: hypothetical protein VI874_00560, partial [Candidatus Norongarragalinales archaeon]|nr:hypothetical protein [Candidatus Norongarragalinales archaeon]